MKSQKILFFAVSIIMSSASANWSAPVYFIGEQKVSAVDSAECFVELKYSSDNKQVTLRGIVTNSHEGHLAPVGELVADFTFIGGSIQKNGYYFQDKTPQAAVKQLVLIAEDALAPTSLTAAIFHDGHHDPVSCENLAMAQGDELTEALELFADFDHLEDHDHAH